MVMSILAVLVQARVVHLVIVIGKIGRKADLFLTNYLFVAVKIILDCNECFFISFAVF